MASAIFFSDIHLEDGHSPKTVRFIKFLETVASQYPKVFILGDLFDVWPKSNRFFIAHYQPVLKALHGLTKQGIEVSYIEGNHDFNFHRTLQPYGIKVETEKLSLTLDGKKFFLTHGDLENPAEEGYHLFRKIVRSGPFNLVLKMIPGSFLHWASRNASNFSRDRQTSIRKVRPDADKIKSIYQSAAKVYLKDGYDVVVMGHIHLPEIKPLEVEGKTGLFVNSGDWITNFTYVTFSDGQFALKTFP